MRSSQAAFKHARRGCLRNHAPTIWAEQIASLFWYFGGCPTSDAGVDARPQDFVHPWSGELQLGL